MANVDIIDDLLTSSYIMKILKWFNKQRWLYANSADKNKFGVGKHLFFGDVYYEENSWVNWDDSSPDLIRSSEEKYPPWMIDILKEIINIYDWGSEYSIYTITSNFQVYGQDGTWHTDGASNWDDMKSIMYMPSIWKSTYGGDFEIMLDDNPDDITSISYETGRVLVFDSYQRHRGLAPLIKKVGRISLVYRIGIDRKNEI